MRKKISEETPLLAFAAGQGVIDRSERKTNNRDFLTKDSSTKTYLLTKYDDIVYNPSNLKYGAIDRNKHGQGVISPIYVTFETEEVSSFIELIVRGDSFKQRALQYEEGTVTKRQSVKPESLLSLSIALPISKMEQQQIGDFFKQLDDTIALHQRKLNLLKQLKQTYLQQLFPQNEENIPALRFAGFSEPWEQRKLIEEVDFFDEKRIPIDSEKRSQGGYPYYGATGVIDYVDNYIFDGEYILLAEDGANIITRNSPIAYITEGKFWLNNHAHIMRMKFGSNLFLLQLLEKQTYEKYNSGTAQPKLNGQIVKNMIFNFPSYEEQIKIGSSFKQLDDAITLHQQKTDNMQGLKNVLLNRMLN